MWIGWGTFLKNCFRIIKTKMQLKQFFIQIQNDFFLSKWSHCQPTWTFPCMSTINNQHWHVIQIHKSTNKSFFYLWKLIIFHAGFSWTRGFMLQRQKKKLLNLTLFKLEIDITDQLITDQIWILGHRWESVMVLKEDHLKLNPSQKFNKMFRKSTKI